jgi:hypothetical protein
MLNSEIKIFTFVGHSGGDGGFNSKTFCKGMLGLERTVMACIALITFVWLCC